MRKYIVNNIHYTDFEHVDWLEPYDCMCNLCQNKNTGDYYISWNGCIADDEIDDYLIRLNIKDIILFIQKKIDYFELNYNSTLFLGIKFHPNETQTYFELPKSELLKNNYFPYKGMEVGEDFRQIFEEYFLVKLRKEKLNSFDF